MSLSLSLSLSLNMRKKSFGVKSVISQQVTTDKLLFDNDYRDVNNSGTITYIHNWLLQLIT